MTSLSLIPSWFFGYNILFELSFAIITLIVSIYAFKIYNLSNQKQPKLFAISFLFISINYFIQSFLNFAILSKLNENICNLMKARSIDVLNMYGAYTHMTFFMVGLITLTYMTLKIKSQKTYLLLILLSILSIIFSVNKIQVFYVMASLLLIYITVYYFKNYIKKKQSKTLLILTAFLFLLFGNIHFVFSVTHGLYYVIGHFLEFIAYTLILVNLILVLKNE